MTVLGHPINKFLACRTRTMRERRQSSLHWTSGLIQRRTWHVRGLLSSPDKPCWPIMMQPSVRQICRASPTLEAPLRGVKRARLAALGTPHLLSPHLLLFVWKVDQNCQRPVLDHQGHSEQASQTPIRMSSFDRRHESVWPAGLASIQCTTSQTYPPS